MSDRAKTERSTSNVPIVEEDTAQETSSLLSGLNKEVAGDGIEGGLAVRRSKGPATATRNAGKSEKRAAHIAILKETTATSVAEEETSPASLDSGSKSNKVIIEARGPSPASTALPEDSSSARFPTAERCSSRSDASGNESQGQEMARDRVVYVAGAQDGETVRYKGHREAAAVEVCLAYNGYSCSV